MMITHPNQSVAVIIVTYPILVKNGKIHVVQVDNNFFNNKVWVELVKILQGNLSSGLKTDLGSFGVRKFVTVDPNVELLMKYV